MHRNSETILGINLLLPKYILIILLIIINILILWEPEFSDTNMQQKRSKYINTLGTRILRHKYATEEEEL